MSWLFRLRWRRALRRYPIDETAWRRTVDRVALLHGYSPDQCARLRALTTWFLYDKHFVGAAGHTPDEALCLAVAAQACIPLLELGPGALAGWWTVIVYPGAFRVRHPWMDDDGVLHELEGELSGEVAPEGPLILSQDDVEHDIRAPGEGVNVVIHEMAHKLDQLNGSANGMPPLHRGMSRERWTHTMSAAFDDLVARVDRGAETAIDPYAAEDPAELFAVVSEAFFSAPRTLAGAYPAVYDELCTYYRQQPLAGDRRAG